jgi:hypothetical protein
MELTWNFDVWWLGKRLCASDVDLGDLRSLGKFNLWYLWWLCIVGLVPYQQCVN